MSFIWNEDKACAFRKHFQKNLNNQEDHIRDQIEQGADIGIHLFIGLYRNSATYCGMKKVVCLKPEHDSQPKWWDSVCKNLKREKYVLLRQFRWTNLDSDFEKYKRLRNNFKMICRKKKNIYQYAKRKELLKLVINPNDFWTVTFGKKKKAHRKKCLYK